MQKIEEEIIRTAKRYCDASGCDERATKVCDKCRCDLCTNHAVRDQRDYGDYPTCYCHRCFEIGRPFMAKIDRVRVNAETEEEKLEDQWRQVCLKGDGDE